MKGEQELAGGDGDAGELVGQLQEAIRRRRAELATADATESGAGLEDLERYAYLEEPVPFSARPLLGRLVVASRKLVRSLFLSWYAGPLLRRQSRFNLAASRRIRELVDADRALRRELEELRRRLGREGDGPA